MCEHENRLSRVQKAGIAKTMDLMEKLVHTALVDANLAQQAMGLEVPDSVPVLVEPVGKKMGRGLKARGTHLLK